jgi:hypothetical protein
MKKGKLNKRLTLEKSTIANLNKIHLQSLKGGDDPKPTDDCIRLTLLSLCKCEDTIPMTD